MTVRYRKDREAWYVDVVVNYPDGTRERIRARSPINTKRAALDYERRLIEEAVARRLNPPPQERTVKEFAEEFLKTYAMPNNKPSEVNTKRTILRLHIIPTLGSLLLTEVTAHRIEQLKAEELKAGLSPKAVNNILAVLHRMLVIANEWGYLSTVPRARLLRLPPPKFDFLTFDEAERLVRAAEGQGRVMILMALKTGMRLGELRALRWDDVDLVARRVVVRHCAWLNTVGTTKTGRDRVMPLCASVLEALRQHRHLRGPLVFCSKNGSMLDIDGCVWMLQRACRRGGLRQVGWHCLRHTFASHLVMRGVPLRAVQEYLGHTTVQMTMRYAHLAPDVGQHAVAVLDEPLPTGAPWHLYGTNRTPHAVTIRNDP